MPQAYWDAYWDYSNAILTLAHEAIHLGGMVGVASGTASSAATRVRGEGELLRHAVDAVRGAAARRAADDAQAIAVFYWDVIYPEYRSSAYSNYWSADCRPGGAMDIRPAGKTAWP